MSWWISTWVIPGDRRGGLGQQPRRGGGDPAPGERRMDPVADLEPVGGDPAVQPDSPRRPDRPRTRRGWTSPPCGPFALALGEPGSALRRGSSAPARPSPSTAADARCSRPRPRAEDLSVVRGASRRSSRPSGPSRRSGSGRTGDMQADGCRGGRSQYACRPDVRRSCSASTCRPGSWTIPGRRAGFVLLAAFLATFLFIRTSARLMRSPQVPWWPGSVTTESGLHLHHLVWGIVLLLPDRVPRVRRQPGQPVERDPRRLCSASAAG